jgi:catalase
MARLAVIGILLACIVGSFAYVGGWLSPGLLTADRLVDGFERVNGVHAGFRRNHAKGVCIAGNFESNGAGVPLSKAAVFRPGRVPIIGRFSLAGGNPYVADGPAAVRAIALAFRPPDGQEWRIATINLPVFAVRTPQAFYEQLIASQPDPTTGKPNPAKMGAFLASHPETARALKIIKAVPFSSGFENGTYYGLNAFRFVNAAGNSTSVRWTLAPVDPFTRQDSAPSATQAAAQDKNYLFDALIARIRRGPVQWHLIVTVGEPGDPTEDATIPWPGGRRRVDLGTVTIDHIEGEARGECRDINFDPLVLPDGIAPSDDPLLSARSAVYSESFTRREGEAKSASAIEPPASAVQPTHPGPGS